MADYSSAIVKKQAEVQEQIKNGTFDSSSETTESKQLSVELSKEVTNFKTILIKLTREVTAYNQMYENNYLTTIKDLNTLRARIIEKIERGYINE